MRSPGIAILALLAACSAAPPPAVVTVARPTQEPPPIQKLALGHPCADGDECSSSSCSPAEHICTKRCSLDRDCTGSGLICRASDSGEGWCATSRGSLPGVTCAQASECAHNMCVFLLGKEMPGACTKPCKAASDCEGTGTECRAPEGETSKLCLPGQGIGVAECDRYLEKYEACLAKMPPAAMHAVQEALKAQRAGFKQVATMPEGRAALAASCKMALDALAQNPMCK